jgi:AcrR family transcriptional regulator
MAKKIKQSPKLPAETRREQLLRSARKLFLRKGYRMTTTEEIARNAGLTKGALYFHFKNKEDILFELVKSIASQYDRAIEAAMTPDFRPQDLYGLLLRLHTKESGLPEYWDMVDIWVQALRIPRIKRYLSQRLIRAIEDFAANLNSSYVLDKRKATDLGILTIALCDGLSITKLLAPSLVDFDRQAGLFGEFVDANSKSPKTRKK